MKEQQKMIHSGKKLSGTELLKIKGGTPNGPCSVEQQQRCTVKCAATSGGVCDTYCRCVL